MDPTADSFGESKQIGSAVLFEFGDRGRHCMEGSQMQYRKDRKGNDISVLGFGCMRFKRKGNGIDTEETEKQILRAIELGINYFDTAYIYSE